MRSEKEMIDKPRFSAIRLIFVREMRDQLRDRRTIFTVAVLPILLYPLMGMLMLQVAQFTRGAPVEVALVGQQYLPESPALTADDAFVEPPNEKAAEAMSLTVVPPAEYEMMATDAERAVREGRYDCVLVVPSDFRKNDKASINVVFNIASDRSKVAKHRVETILRAWRERLVGENLQRVGVSPQLLLPFQLTATDVAEESSRRAAFWSKMLPFVMLVWAMTGAFYPAVDLVAGEKERGTLETLLCSPALRSEIVLGKLMAVVTFSISTALLNVAGLQVTAGFALRQAGIGPEMGGVPPIGALLWLFVALIPLSLLYSATALAVAAMARSSKEGQYYLMPLMMVNLPLVVLPMLPGTTLSIGTSLIPVTGMFLLTRELVEGHFMNALAYLPIVGAVTILCCHLAIRWARKQFESESVLFRSGEQWDLTHWLQHLWRDREATPSVAHSLMAGVIVLVGLFFARLSITTVPDSWGAVVKLVLSTQLGLILTPVLIMAIMLTTSFRTSLRLHWPGLKPILAGGLLALCLHPTYALLGELIKQMYPISDGAAAAMKPFVEVIGSSPLAAVILLLAVVPAICEELTFRGFVMAGLLRKNATCRAILVTALMFGISHGVLQQSIAATLMGCIIGFIAVQTGSVLPGLLLHVTNNALSVAVSRVEMQGLVEQTPLLGWFFQQTAAGLHYQPAWTLVSAVLSLCCLLYFAAMKGPLQLKELGGSSVFSSRRGIVQPDCP